MKDIKSLRSDRDSGIELLRIITMLVIVMHHYVVNSGISAAVMSGEGDTARALFLSVFGWGGKTGINCFMMITGYFMCTSQITLKKFLKLFFQIEFYKVLFLAVFLLSGYRDPTWAYIKKMLQPISSVGNEFVSAFLLFYFMIPFINILINGLDKRRHLILIGICVFIYSILPILGYKVIFNYITWFTVIYLIGAYVRLYPEKWFDKRGVWTAAALVMLTLSWLSVVYKFYTDRAALYFWVSDSNKPLALLTGVTAFMFFKNLNIGYHKWINVIASATFGVLLIHSGNDTIRQWMWIEKLGNISYLYSGNTVLNAFAVSVAIYIICTIADLARLYIIEEPIIKRLGDRLK